MRSRPLRLIFASSLIRTLNFSLSFLLTVVVARAWGANGLAAYSTGLAYGGFAVLIADLGISTASIRWFVLTGASQELYRRVTKIKLVLSAVALPVGCFALIGVTEFPIGLAGPALLTMCLPLLASMLGPAVAVLRATDHMEEELRGLLGERLISTAVASVLALVGAPIWALAGALVGTSAGLLGYLRLRAAPFVTPASGEPVPSRLRDALPYAGALAFETIAFRFDGILLPRFEVPAQVGAYAGAYRFVFVAAGIAAGVQAVLMPRWVPTDGTSRGRRTGVCAIGFGLAATAGCLASALASFVPSLFGGAGFAASANLLHIMSFSVATVPMYYLVSTALVADGATRPFVSGWAAAGTFNLAANAFMIPMFGAEGAAWVTISTDGLLLVLWTWLAVRRGTLAGRVATVGAVSFVPLIATWLLTRS